VQVLSGHLELSELKVLGEDFHFGLTFIIIN
jgi:acid stress-induced BolA-like protein IbaG/YrbA